VRGAAQANAVLATGSGLRHTFAAGQDQGQRAGPEGAGQGLRKSWDGRRKVRQGLDAGVTIGDMHDQRVVSGAAFRSKYGGDSNRVFRIATQAINRLGGQADQATGTQAGDGG
jgi:hypothetical protein